MVELFWRVAWGSRIEDAKFQCRLAILVDMNSSSS